MSFPVHVIGVAMIFVAICGFWFELYRCKMRQWQVLHTFTLLLEYILNEIRYFGTPCTVLLQGAASNNEFDALQLDACDDFSDIAVPPLLKNKFGKEISNTFSMLGYAPHESACAAMERVAVQCRAFDAEQWNIVCRTRQLYPRFGLCMGLLVAIALA